MNRSWRWNGTLHPFRLQTVWHVRYANGKQLHPTLALCSEMAVTIQTSPLKHLVRVQPMLLRHPSHRSAPLQRLLHDQTALLSTPTTTARRPHQSNTQLRFRHPLIFNTDAQAVHTANTERLRFYTYSNAISNGAGASGNNSVSNAYNLDQDLGHAGFVLKNVAFLTGTYDGPWGLSFNPFVIAQSGRPFNITLAADPLNNLFNQRPTYATSSTPVADQVATPYGILDSAALPGEQLIPVNLGTSPSSFAVNLRISRGFSFGGKSTSNRGADDTPMTAAPSSTTTRGDRGPGGGSLAGNIPSTPSAAKEPGGKYSLRFSIQALNLFNNINYGVPIGVLGSPYFNRSTSLIGGAYSTGSAARRIYLQAAFSF